MSERERRILMTDAQTDEKRVWIVIEEKIDSKFFVQQLIVCETNLSFLITDIRVDSQSIFHQRPDFIGAKNCLGSISRAFDQPKCAQNSSQLSQLKHSLNGKPPLLTLFRNSVPLHYQRRPPSNSVGNAGSVRVAPVPTIRDSVYLQSRLWEGDPKRNSKVALNQQVQGLSACQPSFHMYLPAIHHCLIVDKPINKT